MSLAILITSLATELNDTMTTENGGTVMTAISDALSGGLGSTGITDRQMYNLEAEHLANKVFPAVKALGNGGGAANGVPVSIAYIYATGGSVTTAYADIAEFQADFSATFATYYPALGAL